MKLTKKYLLVWIKESKKVILKGGLGNTLATPDTNDFEQFDTEQELEQYIIDNKLKEI